jgi:Tfp pilus tip-associated adhesin PilY1
VSAARSGAGPYWFSLSVVNAAGLGSVAMVEAQLPSGAWTALVHDPNYTSSRPQERYGAWVVPQGTGPFALPVNLRISDPAGRSITATINAWAPASASQTETYYIDTGAQFWARHRDPIGRLTASISDRRRSSVRCDAHDCKRMLTGET